ncbi:MAG TPA: ABC transporter permease [Patescibacteria group bacterium]
MKKFFLLLKKEIRELLTPLMVLPILVTVVLFGAIGKIGKIESEKAKSPQTITVIDQDNSSLSQQITTALGASNFKVVSAKLEDGATLAQTNNSVAYLLIPADLEDKVQSAQSPTLELHTFVRSLSASASTKQAIVKGAVAAINEAVSNQLLKSQTSLDPAFAKQPIHVDEFVAVADREAHVSYEEVLGFVQSQTYFIPIILFLVIVFASQLIATSIATEKENKTLETLLSTPVSRQSIVAAKLVAAGLMALLFSAVYMIGFRSYMDGVTGGLSMDVQGATAEALRSLGLKFGALEYALLGLSLFVGILAALSVALILGAFAEDVKSVQGVVTPLMVLVMIPYFLVMLTDFSTLPQAAQWAVYAIPFAHPFLAIQNIALHHYPAVLYGILYELAFFLVAVYAASRIFSSDYIVTLKLNFSKKK